MKKVIIFLTLFLIPCYVFAERVEYSKSESIAKLYFKNNYDNYKRYLKDDDGTILSYREYSITNNNNNSYLLLDLDYWVSENRIIRRYEKDINKANTRVCNFVKSDVTVSGKGTYNNPWSLEKVYKVSTLSKNTDYGQIDENSKDQYISESRSLKIDYILTEGYEYNGITCSEENLQYDINSNYIIINNIKSDMVCEIDFKPKNISIILNANGGKVDGNNTKTITRKYNEKYNFPSSIVRTDYTFVGWYTDQNAETKINTDDLISVTNNQTIYAHWVKTSNDFEYSGNIQTFTVPIDGTYKLEVWGAQGGNAKDTTSTDNTPAVSYWKYGGKGGYSVGSMYLTKDTTLYIVVGGQPEYGNRIGGYNGGGNAGNTTKQDKLNASGAGGGATHIAITSGLLSELKDKTGKLLIVAGGGGGAYNDSWMSSHYYASGYSFDGGSGGGGNQNGNKGLRYKDNVYQNDSKCAGQDSVIGNNCCTPSGGSDSSAGSCGSYSGTKGSFGKGGEGTGASGTDKQSCGGGSGYYGGGGRYDINGTAAGCGGGSGYINNSKLTTLDGNTSGVKEGNGYSKITLLNLN